MSIKAALKKLDLPEPVDVFVPRQLALNSIAVLPIAVSHALGVASLPPHHGDPFDRLLVAQAMIERITLVSRDDKLDRYGVSRLW